MFSLAKEVLFPLDDPQPLALTESEAIILSAAREYFDNADSCSSTSPYIQLAINW